MFLFLIRITYFKKQIKSLKSPELPYTVGQILGFALLHRAWCPTVVCLRERNVTIKKKVKI